MPWIMNFLPRLQHYAVLILLVMYFIGHARLIHAQEPVNPLDPEAALNALIQKLQKNAKRTQQEIKDGKRSIRYLSTMSYQGDTTYIRVSQNHTATMFLFYDTKPPTELRIGFSMNDEFVIARGKGMQARTYRHYEFPVIGYQFFFNQCQPRFATELDPKQLSHETTINGIAHLRGALPPEHKAEIRKIINNIEGLKPRLKDHQRATLQKQQDMLSDLLRFGTPIHVHEKTGLIMKVGNMMFQIDVSEFSTTTEIPNLLLDPKRTKIMTQREVNEDFLLINADTRYIPVTDEPQIMALMFNTKNGESYRVPYPGDNPMHAAFSHDRNYIAMTGMTIGVMGYPLAISNLKTGEVYWVDTPALNDVIILGMSFSRDNKKLLMSAAPLSNLATFDLEGAILDLETMETVTINLPSDCTYLRFHPDGKHVIGRQIDAHTRERWLFTVDPHKLDSLKRKIKGDTPTVMKDGKTILFHRNWIWYTCDLDFKNVKRFHPDKLNMAISGTLSPDESKMYYVKRGDKDDQGNLVIRIYELDLETGEERLLPNQAFYQAPLTL